jgi:CRP/FNR family transcriptional regulator, cyclic AMP receptor protein
MMIDIETLLTYGATYKNVASGEIIFNEGTQARYYYQVVKGKVRWVNIAEDGKEFIQSIMGEGESFGELPLFDEEPYAATAIADENSLLIKLHLPEFHRLLQDKPKIHFAFSKLFTKRLRFKFMVLRILAEHDPEYTITTLLNYFKKEQKNICTECNRINLTRQQIADMTGLRVETVIRTIRTLHEKGVLVIEKGKVYC